MNRCQNDLPLQRWGARLTLAALLVACGGENDDEGSIELDGGRTASSLSASEAQTFCQRVNRDTGEVLSSSRTVDALCELAGGLTTRTPEACETVKQGCLEAAASEGTFEEDSEDCRNAQEDFAACEATLDEVERCLNDYTNRSIEVAALFSCRDAGQDPPAEPPTIPAYPESCLPLAGCRIVGADGASAFARP